MNIELLAKNDIIVLASYIFPLLCSLKGIRTYLVLFNICWDNTKVDRENRTFAGSIKAITSRATEDNVNIWQQRGTDRVGVNEDAETLMHSLTHMLAQANREPKSYHLKVATSWCALHKMRSCPDIIDYWSFEPWSQYVCPFRIYLHVIYQKNNNHKCVVVVVDVIKGEI